MQQDGLGVPGNVCTAYYHIAPTAWLADAAGCNFGDAGVCFGRCDCDIVPNTWTMVEGVTPRHYEYKTIASERQWTRQSPMDELVPADEAIGDHPLSPESHARSVGLEQLHCCPDQTSGGNKRLWSEPAWRPLLVHGLCRSRADPRRPSPAHGSSQQPRMVPSGAWDLGDLVRR
ncbi:hypothetical protein BO70DRAFT_396308 [Aspergillus heteromorphus CBS 117.55]|uniref:Uncharacterized protein n=1 Tax=Aspergillus heteromorphus CBS 117.55 TaxID=1448321 RepID=A0A317W5Y2_9EURO|nr:uncharacterized protein BO70DRAFT_396308 [Aspergillus heteromorphus CBS 117.55]PWY82016.1 hypothetical protein BO70DRAFT_396308 [Aspergillus heteromorphus CBS 117.55]